MAMRQYLLVLDMDLLAMDEEHDLEPINYLVARQEQEPGEVVVLSLVDTSPTRMRSGELLLGAQMGAFPAAGRQRSSGFDRVLGRDPVHRLRRQWGEQLIVFPDASQRT
jgi:hypothetical protein